MPEAHETNAHAETVRRVLTGVAWGLVPVLFVGWLVAQTEAPMGIGALALALLERVVLMALAGAAVGVAGLFGMRLLRWARVTPESLFARFVLGAGVGLGVVSLVTLGVGCAGFLGTVFAAATLGVMFLVGVPELRAFGEFLRRADRPRARLSFLEFALVFAVLFVLVLQILIAFNLPTDYDACEYHMAAPWRWAQLGRIDYVEGNVYTNLPMNCEMLYLFSMELVGGGSGGWDRLCLGVHLGVVMNLMTALVATGAVYVLARKFWSRRAALVAAALFFTMPWTMVATTVNIHNEFLLAVWAALAVYALLEFRETRLVRWAILSAVFAGLAGGVKYTALAFFIPVGATAVVLAFRGAAWHKRAATALLYAAVVLIVVAPWFAKNYAFTGNPTYPFLYKWFGGRDWSDELDWKWYAGNFKAARADQVGNLFVATWERVIWPKHQWGSAAIALFALLALVAWRQRAVQWLWILLVLWTVLWYFGTHRVDRFWLPFAGIAAALAGRGFEVIERKHRKAALTALLFIALGWQLVVNGLIFSANAAGNYDVLTGNDRTLMRRYDIYPLVLYSRNRETARMLLIGEARTLYLPLFNDGSRFRYSTVFNREAFSATVGGDVHDTERVLQHLEAARIGALFVNWAEVGRLRESYAMPGPDGRVVPGFPPLSPGRFTDLLGGVFVPIPDFGPGFPRASGSLRGLSEQEMKALPGGRVGAIYSTERE